MEERETLKTIASNRKRMAELRERKRTSVDVIIKNSTTTVSINLFIELFSGILFATGLIYAVKFLNLRRAFIDTVHYRTLLGSFTIIGVGWFLWLSHKVRGNILRLRELRRGLKKQAGK